jgi:hypothetical protein
VEITTAPAPLSPALSSQYGTRTELPVLASITINGDSLQHCPLPVWLHEAACNKS